MASSFTLNSAKTAALLGGASSAGNRQLIPHQNSVSFLHGSRSGPALFPRLQGGFKVSAQISEVAAIEKSANSKAEEVIPKTEKAVPDASSISAFMAQAAHLVELVDSRDIVELQLKQQDYEIIIRKKEALPQQQIAAAPVVLQQPAVPQPFIQPQLPAPPSPAPAAAARLPPATPKSSHPPLKSPMSGTFYCSPAPGEPPFVKVGDKVQKGQTLCIIEAMKLMNEIEAEQSGTVLQVLVQDGKPVSLDTPLFIIEP